MIRLATNKDAKPIHDLHTKSVRGLCSKDYPQKVIEGWLKGRKPEGYKGVAKNEMYVFEENDEILGWIHVRPNNIIGLFVAPEHTRKGVGGSLFNFGLDIVRENCRGEIQFEATVTAIPFYMKCGCKILKESSIRKNTVDVPTATMILPE
jgi:GNAT superfamily N-acetyltransferase